MASWLYIVLSNSIVDGVIPTSVDGGSMDNATPSKRASFYVTRYPTLFISRLLSQRATCTTVALDLKTAVRENDYPMNISLKGLPIAIKK
jgi:hypothetical protein